MNLPDQLEFTTLVGDQASSDLIVCLEICVRYKNNFHVWSELSDAAGHVRLTKAELLDQCEKDRAFFLMDYGHPEVDFGGTLIATVATLANINGALSAYEDFKVASPFPRNYLERLNRARSRLRSLPGSVLRPMLTALEPPSCCTVRCDDTTSL